jgi:hypothetical protein
MIKIRLASMSETSEDSEIEIIEGELLSSAADRVLENLNLTDPPYQYFNVTVNGNLIDGDFWHFTSLRKEDTVLFAPKIKNAKQAGGIFVLLAVIAANVVTGGAASTGTISLLQAGLINAGVAIVSSYLVSKLIPPPIMDTNIGGSGSDIRESQVYSISSQANAVRKFQTVPKVYGTHRMFPVVAANPYTELEADPNTGIYSQYMYAIYDFGLGRLKVEDLRIGTTLISEFDQVTYRMVDPNKPNASEGSWDVNLNKTFTIYKGDVASESVSTTMNGNQAKADPIDSWQTVRNAPTNPNLRSQEITVNMICPRGLYAFDSENNIQTRTIETFIEYSPAATENWKPFNDPATVSKSSFVGGGGSQAYTDVPMEFISMGTFDPFAQARLAILRVSDKVLYYRDPFYGIFPYSDFRQYRTDYYMGYPAGTLSVIMSDQANVGDKIKVGERILGTVLTKVLYAVIGPKTWYTYTFTSATTFYVDVQSSWLYTREIENHAFPYTTDIYTEWFNVSYTPAASKEVLIPGKFQIRGATQQQHFATIKFVPITPGDYKVRVKRLSTSSASTTQFQDELTWINIIGRTDNSPILTTKRHVFMEIRIKASGQLNGAIQNLSATCTSALNVWTGAAWQLQLTRNPAWIFADIITGEAAKKPLALSRLHTGSLLEWANFCNQIPGSIPGVINYSMRRYNCDFILDFQPTVQNLLQQVASAAQATPNLIDGKYGVLLDINRGTPTQLFTPRNSWGFESSRNYAESPHAVRVQFIDPSRDWQPNETTIYDDGYNEITATEIQDLPTFGVTNVEQASRYGKYIATQHALRQEVFSLNVDFENLVCTRGDFVQISQDVMKVGGTPARVKTKVGNQITIDDDIIINPVSYGYTYRAIDGVIRTNILTVVDSETFILTGATLPAVGDLIVIGEVGSIVFDCIVKSISPQQDYSATLTLVEKAVALYSFESSVQIANYNPQISPIAGYESVAPPAVTNLVVTDNYYVISDTGINYYIGLDWDMPLNSTFEAFEVYADYGRGYELQTVVKNSLYTYKVIDTYLGIPHNFKVLAVSSDGKKLTLGQTGFVTATPLKYTLPPPDVTGFTSDISGETIHLFWNNISGKSIVSYMIRYSPDVNGTWEMSTQVNTVDSKTNLYSTQARLGKYFIKAINSNLKYSDNAASTITTVPVLPNMNFIDSVNDFPALLGTVERAIKTTDVILDQSVYGPVGNEVFYADGYYYFADVLTLADIYSVRLTAKIIAQGISYNDLMVNWLTLSSVAALTTVVSADWDVELQYRAAGDFTPMSNWITLSSVSSIGDGSGVFTVWRKFLVGDATGKTFQFRLKLISLNPSVTPRVISAEVVAEMSNRSEEFNSLSAPAPGLTVIYGNGFYGPGTTPNVQISLLNGQSGDYWTFSNKTLLGFDIVFYNNLSNPVARLFDVRASGFGRKTTSVI